MLVVGSIAVCSPQIIEATVELARLCLDAADPLLFMSVSRDLMGGRRATMTPYTTMMRGWVGAGRKWWEGAPSRICGGARGALVRCVEFCDTDCSAVGPSAEQVLILVRSGCENVSHNYTRIISIYVTTCTVL